MMFPSASYSKRKRSVHPALLLSLMMFLLGSAMITATAESADSGFQPVITVDNTVLSLRGTGRLRWKGLIKVYDLGLYLPQDLPSTDVFTDAPKRLEFHYSVEIRAKDFGEAAAPYLDKNVPPDELKKLQNRITAINGLYRDVKSGDRYTLTYLPGKGTELAWNGTILGVIDGADFAGAYFRIWLGEHPISESMRRSLLQPPKDSGR
ncbi:MAG TPA: chalcone isomerase family protein [Nitrospirota bacterium]|nr:chalcone isomerase family protein [Nitrospirota bacterium]